MSTRANIFIRESQDDREKECVYHHCDGYPEGLGRVIRSILSHLPKDANGEVLSDYLSKERMAKFICEQDSDFKITTPYIAVDSEFNYEIDLQRRRVDWYATSVNSRHGEQDWLCDF